VFKTISVRTYLGHVLTKFILSRTK